MNGWKPVCNCPMRLANGNCMPAGGFCTANQPICYALQTAYKMGQRDSAKDVTKNVSSHLPSEYKNE